MTKFGRLFEEFPIEGVPVDFAALKKRPCVGIGIGRVDSPDEIPGQAASGFVAIEGLEWRGGEDPAEIPNHRFDHHAMFLSDSG